MECTFITKKESISMKGISILLVLLHHLFGSNPEYVIKIFDYNVLFKVATIAKVSVAIF